MVYCSLCASTHTNACRAIAQELKLFPLCLSKDIVGGLQWVKMVIADVQTVLLDFDDGDLEELSQVGPATAVVEEAHTFLIIGA